MMKKTDFKSQDKSKRNQMIIDAAVRVFHQKGYRTATLDDVANELSLTRPAIYHYVKSKESLLSRIYIQTIDTFFEQIYEIGNLDMTPFGKLRAFMRHYLPNGLIKNLPIFAVFFSEENQLPKKDLKRIREGKRKFTKVVEGIIEEGMAKGFFRRVNPKLQASAIIGMCNWLYRWYKPGESLFEPEEIADQFIDLLENGLMLKSDMDHPEDHEIRLRRKKQILEELKANHGNVGALIGELEELS